MKPQSGVDNHDALVGMLALRLFATVLLVVISALSRPAAALPSFAVQTGQPCAACHVGSFGPQLTQYGRDFKLFGYTASDNKNHFPPLAVLLQESFTHTQQDQPQAASRWFGVNDNIAPIQEADLFYAGRITAHSGCFCQLVYDGVNRIFHWDNSEFRYAHDATLFDEDMVYGITVNNGPSMADLWNSTPTWAFPYVNSALAPNPVAATKIDNSLNNSVIGAGAYLSWNSLIYAEFEAYRGLDRSYRNALGVVPVTASDAVDGVAPYWRVALEHGWAKGEHYVAVGSYGMVADIIPAGIKGSGTDHFVDLAFDANYQWFTDPKSVVSDFLSTHATYIREDQTLNASSALSGTNQKNQLSTMRLDASYAIAATYTPTIQYFRTWGSPDQALWGTANGSPNSSGLVAEFAYAPFGKPDAPPAWANLKITLQYVNYFEFNGQRSGAGNNNVVYLNLDWALGLNHFF